MRTIVLIWVVVALSRLTIPLIEETELTFLLQLVSELPISAVTVWLFLRLTNLHLETTKSMIVAFDAREQSQREHHRATVDGLMKIIEQHQAK